MGVKNSVLFTHPKPQKQSHLKNHPANHQNSDRNSNCIFEIGAIKLHGAVYRRTKKCKEIANNNMRIFCEIYHHIRANTWLFKIEKIKKKAKSQNDKILYFFATCACISYQWNGCQKCKHSVSIGEHCQEKQQICQVKRPFLLVKQQKGKSPKSENNNGIWLQRRNCPKNILNGLDIKNNENDGNEISQTKID